MLFKNMYLKVTVLLKDISEILGYSVLIPNENPRDGLNKTQAGNSHFYFVLFCFCFVFRDRVSLCSPGCPGTHFVEQAGLKLRNLPPEYWDCLLYTSPSPRDLSTSRMPSSA